MLTEEFVPNDAVTIRADGTMEVREATYVLRDGVRDPSFPPSYHRYVTVPGDDTKDRHASIIAIADAVWTPELVAAFTADIATKT